MAHAPRPDNARRSGDSQYVFSLLAKRHGIDPVTAHERLHRVKQDSGRGADDNVVFDLTGNVFDPITLSWLGSLTEGGKGTRD